MIIKQTAVIQSLGSRRFPRELEPLGNPAQLHPTVSQRGPTRLHFVFILGLISL